MRSKQVLLDLLRRGLVRAWESVCLNWNRFVLLCHSWHPSGDVRSTTAGRRAMQPHAPNLEPLPRSHLYTAQLGQMALAPV